MTSLATHPTDEPDLLSLIADEHTPLNKPFADRFRDACRAEAEARDGWVDPNRVRARMLAVEEFSPSEARQYSALWSVACARGGYLVKTDRLVQITGTGSRGNTNKSVFCRRWVGER